MYVTLHHKYAPLIQKAIDLELYHLSLGMQAQESKRHRTITEHRSNSIQIHLIDIVPNHNKCYLKALDIVK